jgi:hypothetical protein
VCDQAQPERPAPPSYISLPPFLCRSSSSNKAVPFPLPPPPLSISPQGLAAPRMAHEMAAFFGAAPPRPPAALAPFREEQRHQDAVEDVYHVDDVEDGGAGHGHGGSGGQGKLCARGHWRPAEDAKLKELVAQYGPQNWNLIAEKLDGRSGNAAAARRNAVLADYWGVGFGCVPASCLLIDVWPVMGRRREELPAAVVQPAGPTDQPAGLLGGGGGAAPGGAPRLRQQVGAHRPPLPGPHRQRRQEPLARPHGAQAARAVRRAPPPQDLLVLVLAGPRASAALRARGRPAPPPLRRLPSAAVPRRRRRRSRRRRGGGVRAGGGHPCVQRRRVRRVGVHLHHRPLPRLRRRRRPLLLPERVQR